MYSAAPFLSPSLCPLNVIPELVHRVLQLRLEPRLDAVEDQLTRGRARRRRRRRVRRRDVHNLLQGVLLIRRGPIDRALFGVGEFLLGLLALVLVVAGGALVRERSGDDVEGRGERCLLYTSPSPRDRG